MSCRCSNISSETRKKTNYESELAKWNSDKEKLAQMQTNIDKKDSILTDINSTITQFTGVSEPYTPNNKNDLISSISEINDILKENCTSLNENYQTQVQKVNEKITDLTSKIRVCTTNITSWTSEDRRYHEEQRRRSSSSSSGSNKLDK